MKNTKRIMAILFFLAGILFFITSIMGINSVLISVGCSLFCLGILCSNKAKDNSKDEKGNDFYDKDK